MAQVPDKVLAWLYSVLHEYRNPQRTYSDTARVLATHPTLRPRTEVYTAENGSSALLVTLSGTIPAVFRGTTYRFPVKIWIPLNYPQEPPIVYVVPAKDMLVRPGQHVGTDGRLYHPYLKDWADMSGRATLAELLAYIQQVFAKEPPVISRPQQAIGQQSQTQQYHQPLRQTLEQTGAQLRAITPQVEQPISQSSNALPPRPPKQHQESSQQADQALASYSGIPPPLPHKERQINGAIASPRNYSIDGPPLPALPQGRDSAAQRGQSFQNSQTIRTNIPQSFPPQYQQDHHQYSNESFAPAPQVPYTPHHTETWHSASPVHSQTEYTSQPGRGGTPQNYSQRHQQLPHQQAPAPYQQQRYHSPHQVAPHTQTSQIQPQFRKQPQPDLLSDPFDITLHEQQSTVSHAAPPIPPNPEREHLLQALSVVLVREAQQKVLQNISAMSPLQAQHEALKSAQARLGAELRQLEQVSQTVESNERILHRAIRECDQIIESAKSKPLPPVDDILVPPTLVAQQLWSLLAEEAAIREAMYTLQKCVDNGRISCEVFVKQMRALGREAFLKMALARKCALGMGLELH